MGTSPNFVQGALTDHARRLDDVEDTISETRRTVIGLDKSVAVLADQLKVITRLMYTAIVGVFGVVGAEVLKLILK